MKPRKKNRRKAPEEFTEPVVCRRSISLEDKYKVVQFYIQLKEEKEKANQALCAPDDIMNPIQAKSKARLRKSLGKNLQAECAAKFPDIVQKVKVCRWHERAVLEKWDQLPQSLRVGLKVCPNAWLVRLGLPKRGRSEGGGVPVQIQQELDRLVVEMAMGASEVSERKEPVTAEQVVSLFAFRWNHKLTVCTLMYYIKIIGLHSYVYTIAVQEGLMLCVGQGAKLV